VLRRLSRNQGGVLRGGVAGPPGAFGEALSKENCNSKALDNPSQLRFSHSSWKTRWKSLYKDESVVSAVTFIIIRCLRRASFLGQ
jgi:hypothetical protein